MNTTPDHRRLQRALFRMQADEAFARALLARAPDAVASSRLGPAELALLEGVELAALTADPGGRRRMQILGNAASEYALTLAALALRPDGATIADGFLGSAEFHRAMADEGRLPLAFGAWARGRAEELGDALVGNLAALELAMAELRRGGGPWVAPGPGEVVLASGARVVRLAVGTLASAGALRATLDGGRPPGHADLRVDGGNAERVLLVVAAPDSPHRLPDVSTERLEPPADVLLERASGPLGAAERAAFAREQGAAPEDLEAFLDGFVAEGVLVRGR